ncbi:hypothetical protein FRC02_002996 [Tulasnella sp. 418]|nr:hypothetical protein FRC02_002996 [Tulasnella sp. 418]
MEQLFKSIEKRLKPTKEEIKTIGVVRSGYIADNGKRPKNTPDTLEICPRIRVLIIGKANTGKLTILQKMCGTTDTPTVIDRNGREIDPSILEDLTFMRGMHDIENELFFPSNPRLRFHDSRGFEAGSTEEIDKVRSFIADRANRIELKDRLHIIWYCVPMDQKRVLRKAELTFFENGTGDGQVVFVIVPAGKLTTIQSPSSFFLPSGMDKLYMHSPI